MIPKPLHTTLPSVLETGLRYTSFRGNDKNCHIIEIGFAQRLLRIITEYLDQSLTLVSASEELSNLYNAGYGHYIESPHKNRHPSDILCENLLHIARQIPYESGDHFWLIRLLKETRKRCVDLKFGTKLFGGAVSLHCAPEGWSNICAFASLCVSQGLYTNLEEAWFEFQVEDKPNEDIGWLMDGTAQWFIHAGQIIFPLCSLGLHDGEEYRGPTMKAWDCWKQKFRTNASHQKGGVMDKDVAKRAYIIMTCLDEHMF